MSIAFGLAAAAVLLWAAARDDRINAARRAIAENDEEAVRQKRLDARIAAERNPGRRAAWRMIRNDELGDL